MRTMIHHLSSVEMVETERQPREPDHTATRYTVCHVFSSNLPSNETGRWKELTRSRSIARAVDSRSGIFVRERYTGMNHYVPRCGGGGNKRL